MLSASQPGPRSNHHAAPEECSAFIISASTLLRSPPMRLSRYLVLSGWLAVSACRPGTVDDAGVEEDAGSSDAGADADCRTLSFYFGWHGPVPPTGSDGVVGVESSASVPISLEPVNNRLSTNRPLPMQCLSASVVGPSGQQVPSRFEGLGELSLSVRFTPDEFGDWSVRVALANNQTRTLTVSVFPPGGPPQLSIAPRCDQRCTGAAVIGCGERLYGWDGGLIAQLDGGTWLCAGTQLFAWQAGALSRAAPGPTTVGFSETIAAPRPVWWSVSDKLLMLAERDLGVVIALDGGLHTVATFTPPGAISGLLVTRDGLPLVLEGSQAASYRACKPSGGCLDFGWSQSNIPHRIASADRDGFWVARGVGSFGILPLWTRYSVLPDGGVGSVDFGPSRGNERQAPPMQAPNWQPLFDTERGVRRSDGGVMYLPGASEVGSTEEAVWQTAREQTAFWR